MSIPTLSIPVSDQTGVSTTWALIMRVYGVPVPYVFPLAPQMMSVDLPSRGMVHQTVDSNFLDLFPGTRATLARLSLRGTFGYCKKRGGIGMTASGALQLKVLETLIETFNAVSRQLHQTLQARWDFVAPGRGYYWRVFVDRFSYRQAATDPLLFYYDVTLTRLQDYLSPSAFLEAPGQALQDLIGLPSSANLSGLFGKVSGAVSSLGSFL